MLGVTSEGSSSHLHRCVCPHMVPEECSLSNSLHLFAFFNLCIPPWSPPQVLSLHQRLWNFQGSKSTRILRCPEWFQVWKEKQWSSIAIGSLPSKFKREKKEVRDRYTATYFRSTCGVTWKEARCVLRSGHEFGMCKEKCRSGNVKCEPGEEKYSHLNADLMNWFLLPSYHWH